MSQVEIATNGLVPLAQLSLREPEEDAATKATFNGRLVANRVYMKHGHFGKKGAKIDQKMLLSPMQLRDKMAKIRQAQAPKDFHVSFATAPLSFVGGKVSFRNMSSDEPNRVYLMTKNAFRQAARLVTGVHEGNFLLDTSDIKINGKTEVGERTATAAWALWSTSDEQRKKLSLCRTANMNLGGQSTPVVRAFLSPDFATYDNIQFMEAILKSKLLTEDHRLVQAIVSDDHMRLRFVAARNLTEMQAKKPVPMFEIWNSETGHRRVFIRAGTFTLVCTNGLHHWSSDAEYSWRHYGSMTRIENGVEAALKQLSPFSHQIVAAYKQAMEITADDLLGWVNDHLDYMKAGLGFRKAVNDLIIKGDETSTLSPQGRPCLASAIDAVTMIAQNLEMNDQFDAERWAGSLLARGISEQQNNRIVFDV